MTSDASQLHTFLGLNTTMQKALLELSAESLEALSQLQQEQITRFAELFVQANSATRKQFDQAGPGLVVLIDEAVTSAPPASYQTILLVAIRKGLDSEKLNRELVTAVQDVSAAVSVRSSLTDLGL